MIQTEDCYEQHSFRRRRRHDAVCQARHRTRPTPKWARTAVRMALEDAGLDYGLIQQAYAGYVYGDSTCGQAVLYERRHDRHPGDQRQQQLLHRLDRAVPGATGCASRAWSTARWRSASSRWRPARSATCSTTGPRRWASSSMMAERAAGHSDSPMAHPALRRRWQRVPGALRHPGRRPSP